MTLSLDDILRLEARPENVSRRRRERRIEFLTGIALALGAVLAVVVFYATVALVGWNYRQGIDDEGPNSNLQECRYDPRYGDDC
mgnify:CR=1 FL=1